MNTQLLNKHLDLVIEANKITNITRISSVEEAQLLHIEDSLTGLPYMNNAPAGRYADMGSGAGYPGIPLAIETQRDTVLIESVNKKAVILSSFVSELGLSNIEVYPGRVEELALQKPRSFSVITARALSKLGSLMELAAPLLQIGGHLICYKGSPEEEEIKHAKELCAQLGFSVITNDTFMLSDNETTRTIIVFEKIKEPSIKLPRHVGFAQKRPL